jgi:hypothetical protein
LLQSICKHLGVSLTDLDQPSIATVTGFDIKNDFALNVDDFYWD